MRRLSILLFAALLTTLWNCKPEKDITPSDVSTYIKLIGDPDYPLTAVDATMDNDGNVILLANAESEEDGKFTYTPMIVRVDRNGNLIGEMDGLFDTQREIETSMLSHSLTRINDDSYLIVGEVINEQSFVAMAIYSVTNGFSGPYTVSVNGNEVEGVGKTGLVVNPTNNYFIVANNGAESMVFEINPTALDDANGLAPVGDNMYNMSIDSKTDVLGPSYQSLLGNIYWAGPISFASPKAEISVYDPQQRNVISVIEYPLDVQTLTFTAFEANAPFNFIAGTVPDGDETRPVAMAFEESTSYFLEDPFQLNRQGNDTPVSISSSDNGFAVLGITEQGNGEEDFVLMNFRINTDADVLELDFMQSFGGENADVPKKVIHDSDGGFVMFGYTEFSDVNTLLLIKCNKDGGL